MTTIEFPKKPGSPDENAAEEAELELEAEGEALDLDLDDEPASPSPTPAARAQGQSPASIGIALLLIVSLAAVGVLWKQRGDLRAQVAGLENALVAAATREAQTQTAVGDVAKQLEAIQTVLGSLLTARASDEVGSETEAAAQATLDAPDPSTTRSDEGMGDDAQAATGDSGWVDRALTR